MIKKQGNFKFKENLEKYRRFKKEIPKIIANNSKNHFLKGFKRGAQQGGGFTDDSISGWQKRKKETRISARKGILIHKGHLRRFIQTRGVLKTSFNRIEIGVRGIPYAAIHNEGLRVNATQNVPSHTRRTRFGDVKVEEHTRRMNFKMPKREYIGDSKMLDKKNQVLINNYLKKVFS